MFYNVLEFLEYTSLRNKRQNQGKGEITDRVANARQQTRKDNFPVSKMEIRRYLGHSDHVNIVSGSICNMVITYGTKLNINTTNEICPSYSMHKPAVRL